ncbi:MAG: aldehyde dehydrogenase family protein, partial [Spirochaetota bacterium]|nr:aldehyde dehydrogenase family protein [Spirochaetota bacterium]
MNYRGDYIAKSFIQTENPDGHIHSVNPGDLDEVPITIPYSLQNLYNAVDAARNAFSPWKSAGLQSRAHYLTLYQKELENRKEDIAFSISREVGKPLWESRQEVAAMISKVTITLQQGLKLIEDLEVPDAAGTIPGHLTYKPHGVLAVIGPFNFPAHLPNGHIVPALITGNTVLFKPSELTPLTGQIIAEIMDAIDLPAGVFNMIQGGAQIGSALTAHEGVDGV